MIAPKVITAPTYTPVSIDEAKLQCRVDGSDEDDLFTLYIEAARAYYESRTARTIHETVLEYCLDDWPSDGIIVLPRATPLVSVSAFTYKDSAGASTALTLNTDYIVDTDSTPGRVTTPYGVSWPSFTAYPFNPIRIRYKAGIAAPVAPAVQTEAGSDVKIPILMLINGLYQNRESIIVSDMSAVAQIAVDYGVEAFIQANVATYVF